MLLRAFPLFALLMVCLAAQAAADIFMKVDGIPGDSQDARHRNEIVLTSYAFGFSQTATARAGGGGAGRVSMSPFIVTKFVDSSSPRLALACATGEHLREVKMAVRQEGREQFEFLRFTLNDVVISGFAQNLDSEGMAPVENMQLTFVTIEMEYIPQRPDGSAGTPVRMKWDVQRNMPG